ncbi:TPA: hypothetical protein ACGDUJ_004002 [Acinetobacter baumannii]|uniref:hypothetical protein n=1 Tax=Acinetobacter baumannii TaxID=470 RepID=UPI001660D0FE|nr:hypothetical protein [Acinetobacter baumannii]ELA6826179.1 hypothetical protein [Acinetobacter baumannii]ELA6833894.1 hypothetical protein [Acinetobacter baumannii]ELA6842129.1 hypothetical protein [Acinetobacter baumannii]ELA6862294.1 hypothetical protein [Acinetobacter baumannii]MBD0448303.1 hypothetical protein [Acinetobacter baumannii]
MSNKKVIALRLPDKMPSDLKFNEMAELFKQFSHLLKGVDDKFGYIQEGSVYVGSSGLSAAECEAVIANILNSEGGDLDLFLNKHKDWGDAQIGIHDEGAHPQSMRILRTIESIEKPLKFKQIDVLRGTTRHWSSGKDETDHIGISFLDGTKISAKSSKLVTAKLNKYFGTDTLIDFSGEATYCYADNFELELVDFRIDNVEILEDVSIDKWVDEFVGYGKSGWQEFDDPYEILKDERST